MILLYEDALRSEQEAGDGLMCGIGGIRVSQGSEVVVAGLRRMGQCMAARGPDDEGLFIGPGVGLVHRRLSILDLSELGNCPMPNEDGSIQALLNGEIYNWRELRAELLAHGHRFRSMADSEVLSHGYEEWGEALFARLRGMFALAIWDQPRARLLLARDRMGEKPLFLLRDGGQTLFASSIPALLAYDEKPRPVNPDAIVCCLCAQLHSGDAYGLEGDWRLSAGALWGDRWRAALVVAPLLEFSGRATPRGCRVRRRTRG